MESSFFMNGAMILIRMNCISELRAHGISFLLVVNGEVGFDPHLCRLRMFGVKREPRKSAPPPKKIP